jgi:multisubunit Na+/H+ antiporter MnhF subunit
MELREIPKIAWIVVAAALLIAMMRLPYGYYTFTRILTCGFCTLIAILSFQEIGAPGKTWALVFVIVGIAFNPFIPLRLSRFTWLYLDLVAGIVVSMHLLFVRRRLDQASQER